jgi:hypothetical protein
VTGGDLAAEGLSATTGADGTACVGPLTISAVAGDYTVTEEDLTNYAEEAAKTATVTVGDDCSEGEAPATVNFLNTPLTDVTVSVDSLEDGGTFSSIECDVDGSDTVSLADAMDDPSITIEDLEPRTVVCTIVIDP